MDAETILNTISDETDLEWNDWSKLAIMADYINKLGDPAGFEDYVRNRAQEEFDYN